MEYIVDKLHSDRGDNFKRLQRSVTSSGWVKAYSEAIETAFRVTARSGWDSSGLGFATLYTEQASLGCWEMEGSGRWNVLWVSEYDQYRLIPPYQEHVYYLVSGLHIILAITTTSWLCSPTSLLSRCVLVVANLT